MDVMVSDNCLQRAASVSMSMVKRPQRYYFKLESESSRASEEDTESIYSLQGYETDVVQDTPDTDTKSEDEKSNVDLDLEVEYEVDSLSEGEENPVAGGDSSSGTDDVLAAAGAIAAVICDTSLETWLTDGEDSNNSSAGHEDSDNSSMGDAELNRTDFWTCIQCKSQNNNPSYRYCQKCFQVRKNLFPPRPRGHRKKKRRVERRLGVRNAATKQKPVSQDSGIGSSQDLPPLQLDMVPSTSNELPLPQLDACDSTIDTPKAVTTGNVRGMKRKNSTTVDDLETTSYPPKKRIQENGNLVNKSVDPLPEYKELCIMCNATSKNSIFLHGKIAHMCCCYKCAMRTWNTSKRCPMCNGKVKNVVKVFTS